MLIHSLVAFGQGFPPVHWYFHFDPRGETKERYRCKHVMLLEGFSNVSDEVEYLFTAYSVFTVRSTTFPAKVLHGDARIRDGFLLMFDTLVRLTPVC